MARGLPAEESVLCHLPSKAIETAQKYEAPSTYHLAWPVVCGAKEEKRWFVLTCVSEAAWVC